jgi:hypothetical protein
MYRTFQAFSGHRVPPGIEHFKLFQYTEFLRSGKISSFFGTQSSSRYGTFPALSGHRVPEEQNISSFFGTQSSSRYRTFQPFPGHKVPLAQNISISSGIKSSSDTEVFRNTEFSDTAHFKLFLGT